MIEIKEKSKCCGCRACEQICPKSCINMKTDEEGYIYPEIDKNKCVHCNLCDKVCCIINQKNETDNKLDEIKVYAAYNLNKSVVKKSSSGGVFSLVAEKIIDNGGYVCGCSLNESLDIKHILINEKKYIKDLRGSKYIQSDINNTYSKIKNILDNNKDVLFVGVPCQVAGLKRFLKEKRTNIDKLITIDLICHGVPSKKIFDKYIQYVEKKNNIEIKEFNFRDKSREEWGLIYSYTYKKNGIYKKLIDGAYLSPYYYAFLNNMIFRPVCYECPFATQNREGDITLGDYWGVKKYHPNIDDKLGVSAILINTKKGMEMFETIKEKLYYVESSFKSVKEKNSNLYKPSNKPICRDEIYREMNSINFDKLRKRYLIPRRYPLVILKNRIPIKLKKIIKSTLDRRK